MSWKRLTDRFFDFWAKRKQRELLKQRLVIGFDFGTAFTKVIIGESRKRYVVPFFLPDGNKSVCAPCILYIDNEGYGSLSPTNTCERRYNLKMSLFEGKRDLSLKADITVYIALVLQYARKWLNTEHYTVYKGIKIDWSVNIGLPTEKYDDTEMEKVYCTIFRAAWYLSKTKEKISIQDAIQCLNNLENGIIDKSNADAENWIHPDMVKCFPEFAAMVTGYARSHQRKKDLHTLIDIGAGTVDMTVFNVNQDQGEDILPIFARGVKPLGVIYLLQQRYKKLKIKDDIDPIQNAPDNESFALRHSILLEKLNEIDKDFCNNFYRLIGGLLGHVKQQRYPMSPRWKEGVPCFLCGGGRDMKTYRDELNKFQEERFPLRIVLNELPFPNDLERNKHIEDNIHRLLVAYGLSYDPDDIGKIIKSQNIEDAEPPLVLNPENVYFSDYGSRIDR